MPCQKACFVAQNREKRRVHIKLELLNEQDKWRPSLRIPKHRISRPIDHQPLWIKMDGRLSTWEEMMSTIKALISFAQKSGVSWGNMRKSNPHGPTNDHWGSKKKFLNLLPSISKPWSSLVGKKIDIQRKREEHDQRDLQAKKKNATRWPQHLKNVLGHQTKADFLGK